MFKRRHHRLREKGGVRVTAYILLLTIIVCVYLSCQYFFAWSWLTETVATVIAIISAVAFWLEYRENKLLNEAQFITDLNEQFIGSETMADIEWELDKFYTKYRKGMLTEEDIKKFRDDFNIESKNHQKLVNYLVHLEGVAALVKNKVLHINMIDDLMSYRYFIAMNNPIVQELKLNEYPDFYKGCFCIYNAWVDELEKQEIEIPMYREYKLIEKEK